MAPVDLATPDWKIHRGQAVWQPRADAPELAGQILIASSVSGEDFVRFSKDPMEMVLARRDNGGWVLKIPAFNKSYSGRGRPPKRIAWFHLANAVACRDIPRDWEWSGIHEGRWEFTNTRTGERLEGFFNQ
jgi:hypothetical protein